MSVCARSTSVPRWDAERLLSDPDGRYFTVASFGNRAHTDAAQVVGEHSGHRVSWLKLGPQWSAATSAVLQREFAAARVGWRLIVIGAEIEVLQARSAAIAAGAIPAEILTYVTGDAQRRVYCVHCRHVHRTDTPVGALSPCPRCRTDLFVYHHVSRRYGAYLGFMADAEEQ
ncbi:UNVERIFIED_ORG: hypothetical protein FNL38_103316 [Nocardia globerula]|uniref:Dimethylamine monooxygenase subunit DmmA-like C-terminal domain-containing protein n=1 Tax=Nocardia globerula TaxID=1818 RepID=A0A652YRL2_NOCGL|nr:dimethylamine monooxygenase subunit DmmA family protein [Rhodococcus globerulus]NMD63444.1 hypothetical protein [Nocardia globerula]PVX63009.1 hypothetical protein C8E04_0260 [Rhodococcus globerulus]